MMGAEIVMATLFGRMCAPARERDSPKTISKTILV